MLSAYKKKNILMKHSKNKNDNIEQHLIIYRSDFTFKFQLQKIKSLSSSILEKKLISRKDLKK